MESASTVVNGIRVFAVLGDEKAVAGVGVAELKATVVTVARGVGVHDSVGAVKTGKLTAGRPSDPASIVEVGIVAVAVGTGNVGVGTTNRNAASIWIKPAPV